MSAQDFALGVAALAIVAILTVLHCRALPADEDPPDPFCGLDPWEYRAMQEHEFYFGDRRGARSPGEIELWR